MKAVDIYPVLLADQPDNLDLAGFDLNQRLDDPRVFDRNYDLIHSRFVCPGIRANRWRSYIRDMKGLLRPGGWVQLVEYYANVQSSSGLLATNSALTRWWQAYARAMEDSNRAPRIGTRLQDDLRAAGLRDVGGTMYQLPLGGWDPGI